MQFGQALLDYSAGLSRVGGVERLFCQSIVSGQIGSLPPVALESIHQNVILTRNLRCCPEDLIPRLLFPLPLLLSLHAHWLGLFATVTIELKEGFGLIVEGESGDWVHEGEVLRVMVRGVVVLHEDCIAAVGIVVVFVVLDHC
jgi:hypothetical protein